MNKEQLLDTIKNHEEDFYPNDRKDNFHTLKLMRKDEDEDEWYSEYSSENIYVLRDEDEIYWVKMQREEFNKILEYINDEDEFKFGYEEGNDNYADEYDAEIVSVTPRYIYFELEASDD